MMKNKQTSLWKHTLNKVLISLLYLAGVFPAHSQCLLGSDFVDNVTTFYKSLKAVKSFTNQPANLGVPPYIGSVTTFKLTEKFMALRLEPKSTEKKAFIFGIDISEQSFYVYYTNGVTEPYPNMVKGKTDLERCSIYFSVSETEEFEIKIYGEGNLEIISVGRENINQEFRLIQRFNFSPNENLNSSVI